MQSAVVISEDSECLDHVAKMSHQDWGKTTKLTQVTRRALRAWLNEDRVSRGLNPLGGNVSNQPTNSSIYCNSATISEAVCHVTCMPDICQRLKWFILRSSSSLYSQTDLVSCRMSAAPRCLDCTNICLYHSLC